MKVLLIWCRISRIKLYQLCTTPSDAVAKRKKNQICQTCPTRLNIGLTVGHWTVAPQTKSITTPTPIWINPTTKPSLRSPPDRWSRWWMIRMIWSTRRVTPEEEVYFRWTTRMRAVHRIPEITRRCLCSRERARSAPPRRPKMSGCETLYRIRAKYGTNACCFDCYIQ